MRKGTWHKEYHQPEPSIVSLMGMKFLVGTKSFWRNHISSSCCSIKNFGMRSAMVLLNSLLCIWKDILKDLSVFWKCLSFRLRNGSHIIYLKDTWIGTIALAHFFDDLHFYVVKENVSVAS